MKHRKEIIIETHQVQVIHCRKPETWLWCNPCSATVRMVTAEEAAALAQVKIRTIYRWAEAGELHFTESPEGTLLICPNSLTN